MIVNAIQRLQVASVGVEWSCYVDYLSTLSFCSSFIGREKNSKYVSEMIGGRDMMTGIEPSALTFSTKVANCLLAF